MAQKMHSINKLSKGSSLQVMEKDKEWKDKLAQVESKHTKEMESCQRAIEAGEREKGIIKRNYDS